MPTSEAYLRTVELPSRGQFYGDSLPDGRVTVIPMGPKQEKLFSAGNRSAAAIIDRIFEDCVKLPMDHKDLVVGDRLHILWQLRAISYGDLYSYSFKCHAGDCGKKNTVDASISALPIKYAKPDSSGVFTVTLPILKKTVEFRLLTGKDEEKVEAYNRQVMAKNGGKETGDEYIYRLARRIETIDGEKAAIKPAMELVEALAGDDNTAFKEALEDSEIGPEIFVTPECTACGFVQDPFVLPMSSEFFRPRRRRPTVGADSGHAMVPTDDSGL